MVSPQTHLAQPRVDFGYYDLVCSKPIKRGELLARISAHLRVKDDATWVHSLVNGAIQDDAEAMVILKSILPEPIILRLQVRLSSSHTCLDINGAGLGICAQDHNSLMRFSGLLIQLSGSGWI